MEARPFWVANEIVVGDVFPAPKRSIAVTAKMAAFPNLPVQAQMP
jgi:hypothetical protein